jgi:hypothetical protein
VSGLSQHRAELERLRRECDEQLRELVDFVPSAFPGVDTHTILMIASAKSFLPSKADWDEWTDEDNPWVGYVLVRVLCLHPRWRTAGTIFAKATYGQYVVVECAEAL